MALVSDFISEAMGNDLCEDIEKDFDISGYKFVHSNRDGWIVESPYTDNHYDLCELVSYEGASTHDVVAILAHKSDYSDSSIIGYSAGASMGLEPDDPHGMAAYLVTIIKEFEGKV